MSIEGGPGGSVEREPGIRSAQASTLRVNCRFCEGSGLGLLRPDESGEAFFCAACDGHGFITATRFTGLRVLASVKKVSRHPDAQGNPVTYKGFLAGKRPT
ncbi:MAG: hypothetical protein COX79_02020 [Candidatus Levybacteria bacterium CG_4_10_14_0_2_um_filter_36_16]|nr:MAG: hypothetical protein AUK12_02555 [Candidatus Levybacteria bacterium CG2_30_37_29]PIR79049.1 MAG: hypothetical protein COU26_03290 [Candidatus Levybacteria bacterium CG10_big_fil_rev_8_21_14_0_10_36_30]PIZ97507.1 MAG: hypothetical protein COX79_02020 [Candidatus Levybacteria bacterium CG_4_10_14_0_2_um_filter_36_16]PJA90461.1 MAG: hypothetical protein CO136_02040 [Candidatus Levybacteria bacterium CG_4_9_14_3_um_filter_36_7]